MRFCLLALPLVASVAKAAPLSAEVMHWWTSGSESKALKVLKDRFEQAGGKWIDSPVAGGGGDAARSVLKSRFVAGHPPSAAQVQMGPQMMSWAEEDVLVDLSDLATRDKWDTLLPKPIADSVKYHGHYVGAPINVHRINWMWINPRVLAKVNAQPPKTWDEFNSLAEKLQRAGIIPFAHGGQPWQDVLLFEDVAFGLGGPDFYRRAFIDLDPATLGGPTMIKVFDQMRRLKGFVDKSSPGRDWNLATGMVIRGEAALQLMGDWVKGEFAIAGQKPGVDYICLPSPGTRGTFSLNNDSIMMLQGHGAERLRAQKLLASLVLDEKFQEEFNIIKGSIPTRIGVSSARFDPCAQASMRDFAEANAKNTAVVSFSGGVAASPAVSGAMFDVITNHFNSNLSSSEAAKRLAAAAAANK
ncbi:MAG: carbohydrate ABC transporter substrate-binding protein [Bdellovibrionales bacterium]|nr:carbohydrate ABC transporter substrate-binding protein [Bdellovibrionales bacterium]